MLYVDKVRRGGAEVGWAVQCSRGRKHSLPVADWDGFAATAFVVREGLSPTNHLQFSCLHNKAGAKPALHILIHHMLHKDMFPLLCRVSVEVDTLTLCRLLLRLG